MPTIDSDTKKRGNRPRKVGRPHQPGSCVYIRLAPGLREKIDAIHAAETPAIGKLSLNELINRLLVLGVEKYHANGNRSGKAAGKPAKKISAEK